MVLLTPRFAALLLLIASVHAAIVPHHHNGLQMPFHVRSMPDTAPSTSQNMYTSSLHAFLPFLLPRRSSPTTKSAGRSKVSGKKPSSKKTKPKTTAPVPDSAKPASEKNASDKPSAPNNMAAAQRKMHIPGQHHRGNKGHKNGKSKGHKSKGHKSKKHKSGKSKKQKEHRGLPEDEHSEIIKHGRAKSRFFGRLEADRRYKGKTNAIIEGRNYHELDRDRSYDHDHSEINVHADIQARRRRGHDDDDDDDDDDGHHHHHHHHHHSRSEDDPDLLDVEVELFSKRDHDHRHRHHHHHHDKKEVMDANHVLILHDVGHKNFGKSYHVHGRRKHHRRISEHIHAHSHDRHHGHEDSHVHKHIHGKRAMSASLGARNHKHEHIHEHKYVHEHEHIHGHEHKHKHKHGRRASSTRVPGTIEIVSKMEDGGHVKIANLVATGVDNATRGALSNASFVLNASNDTQTQVFLVPSDSSVDGKPTLAALQVDVYDPQQVKVESKCVTYDPSPSAPGPLTVESCGQGSTHVSQMFEYTPSVGTLRPMWTGSTGSNSTDSSVPVAAMMASGDSNANNTVDGTAVDPVSANSSSVPSEASANNSTSNSAPSSTSSSASPAPPRTVALMFRPHDPEEPNAGTESDPSAGFEGSNAALEKEDALSDAYRNGNEETSFYPQASITDNNTNATSIEATNATTSASTTMDSAAGVAATSTGATSSPTASAAAAVDRPSKTSTATAAEATSTNATAADADMTASTATVTGLQSAASGHPVDAAAPYEYMFTATAQR